MSRDWDVIVIGGGAAGLSATLMLGRARRRVLVVDEGSPRNRFAAHMHGVLGHEGTPPAELLARGREEVAGYGAVVREGRVSSVEDEGAFLRVRLNDGTAPRARMVVVATGVSDDLPEMPGLRERWGRSVLHCPYCHGWEVRDRRLGVIAFSPMSLHQAELIRQWTDRVVLFSAGAGELDPALRARLRSRGVSLVDSPVVEVRGEGDTVSAVVTADGQETPVDAIFTGGTLRPLDAFLDGLALDRTDTPFGSVLSLDERGRTSHPRIWAAGNVVTPGGNVPMSVGAGAICGAQVNAALVAEDFDLAVAAQEGDERD